MLASNRHIEADNKCVSMEEINNRDCLAKNLSFFGGNPPHRGRGVPKNAHTQTNLLNMFI